MPTKAPVKYTPITSVYAIVGVGDAIVAKLRDVRVERPQFDVDTMRTQVRELPEQAQARVAATVDAAVETYDELATRGERLVTRIRHQQASEDFTRQAKSTVSKTKAARTTARKSASRTRKSASAATRSAVRDAARTGSAAKGAATSARNTVEAATTAAEAAAEKVGN